MNEKHLGSDLDDVLREDGLLEEVTAVATERLLAHPTAEALKKRLRKDRPMITIRLPLPEDVVDDLTRVAPRLGFSGYQPLLRAYVGQGLRRDLERLEGGIDLAELVDALARRGVDEAVIAEALAEVRRG